MKYSIKAASAEKISADCVVVTVWSKGTLSDEAKLIDRVGNKNISNITRSGDFTGKLGETQAIHRPTGARAKRVLLLGAGDRRKFTAKNAVKFTRALRIPLAVFLKYSSILGRARTFIQAFF